MVAEEVRHFLDEAELGVTPTTIVAAFEKETKKNARYNVRNMMNWHHRRVFTRLIQDVRHGHPVIITILNDPNDLESLYEAYTRGAYGRRDQQWLESHLFSNPFHND